METVLQEAGKSDRENSLQFDLRRYFSLTCFGIFIVVTAVMCTGFYHISKIYIRTDAEQRAVPIAERLGLLAFNQATGLSPPGTSAYARLDTLMRSALEPLRIFKINIYDAQGRIVYSTDPETQVGATDPGNPRLARALDREVISKLATRTAFPDLQNEEQSLGVVVETYVPIPLNVSPAPLKGVVEIYSDVTQTYARLPGLIGLIVAASVLAMGILYTILYLIVRRAGEIIAQQTKTISQAKADVEQYAALLEQRVKERTDELRLTLAQQRHDDKMVAMGTFAAGLAHELNTPLGTILNSTQLVLEHCLSNAGGNPSGDGRRPDSEQCRQCVEDLVRVESEARRCRDIIRNLANFSRKSDGERTLVDLRELVERSAALLERQASKQNVSLDVETIGEPRPVMVNANEIEQVLVNIMGNGITAMPQGGRLGIRLSQDGKTTRIEINDTGTGIDESVLPRIFEPFFTTKEVGKGTGLGLSISYRIVKDHGGNILVSSIPGKGSSFTVQLNTDDSGCNVESTSGYNAPI